MGRVFDRLGPKTIRDLEDAAVMVESGSWSDIIEPGTGACIPVAYAVSHLLTLRGRPSRVSETRLRIEDPLNRRWAEIQPGDSWLGHVVVIVTDQKLLVDGSLWSQPSKVLANVEVPYCLVTDWRRGRPSVTSLGRMKLTYTPDLKAKGWSKRRWPWKELREAVERFDRQIR